MAVAIPDNFCGYVYLYDSRYFCSINGHSVKMLPELQGIENDNLTIAQFARNSSISDRDYDYIYGYDESSHRIAFLYNELTPLLMTKGYHFFSPIIIKGTGNLRPFYDDMTKDWDMYDAIVFSGGIIDSLYNPKVAALKIPTDDNQKELFFASDGANSITIKPFRDYSHQIKVVIDGQDAQLQLSISQGDFYNRDTTDLGYLESFISLRFDNPQKFISIHKYIRLLQDTLSVFSRQRNIDFDVIIKQKTTKGSLMETGTCKIYIGSEDIYKPKSHQVIDILELFNYLPEILRVVESGEADTLLSLLPERNKDHNIVTMTNIQDLCTALEAEYMWLSQNTPTNKDASIQELRKKIKVVIKDFAFNNACIDPYTETTISSCFHYLDLNLKNKIFTLYDKHKTTVDVVRKKHNLPDITIEDIGEFVKLRNAKTHVGKYEFNNNINQYTTLFALAHSCFFARVGVPEDIIADILLQLFR